MLQSKRKQSKMNQPAAAVPPLQLKKQEQWKKDLANKLMPRMHGKPQKLIEAFKVFEEVDDLSGTISQALSDRTHLSTRLLPLIEMLVFRRASGRGCNRSASR